MRQIPAVALIMLIGGILCPAAALAEAPATVTHLMMRDHSVTITSSSEGLRYSVFMPDGAVLAANLSAAQLAVEHPEVYEQVSPAIANEEMDVIPWAGM